MSQIPSALFTDLEPTDPAMPVVCGLGARCKSTGAKGGRHPPGTSLSLIEIGREGFTACGTCFMHYSKKPTTVIRTMGQEEAHQVETASRVRVPLSILSGRQAVPSPPVPPALRIIPRGDVIHQNLSAAQRMEGTAPVRTHPDAQRGQDYIPPGAWGQPPWPYVPQYPNHPQPPQFAHAPGYPLASTYPFTPALHVPGYASSGPTPQAAIGYGPQHANYLHQKAYYQQLATTPTPRNGGNAPLGDQLSIKIQVGYCKVTKVAILPGFTTGLDCVPTSIGYEALKACLVRTIAQEWAIATRSYPLDVQDFDVKHGATYSLVRAPAPNAPDVNCIAELCYLPGGKKKLKKSIVLTLFLHTIGARIATIIEDIRDEEEHAPTRVPAPPPPVSHADMAPTTPRGTPQSLFGTFALTASHDRPISEGLSPPRKKVRQIEFKSPDRDSVLRSLQNQTEITEQAMKDFESIVTVDGLLYPSLGGSFQDLLNRAPIDEHWLTNTPHKCHATISFQPAERIGLLPGSFKSAHAASLVVSGTTTTRLSGRVCLKRAITIKQKGDIIEMTPLPRSKAFPKIASEFNNLAWGHGLLKLVMDFVASEMQRESAAPFSIPAIRFTEYALFVGQKGSGKTGSQSGVYLLEELLEGDFSKYINNDSVIPLPTDGSAALQDKVDFLGFAQHVQYVKTGKLVFLSDWQGCDNVFTDPQVLSHPSLGPKLFSDGNVSKGFRSLSRDGEHECNKFCRWFGLGPIECEDDGPDGDDDG